MRIRFLRDELYENEGRLKGHLFKAGEVHDLPDDQAHRWLRRLAAERLDQPEGFKPLGRRSRSQGEADGGSDGGESDGDDAKSDAAGGDAESKSEAPVPQPVAAVDEIKPDTSGPSARQTATGYRRSYLPSSSATDQADKKDGTSAASPSS